MAFQAANQPPGQRHVSGHAFAVVLGWIGLVLHILVGFLYLAAGLVAPLYGILFFWAAWIALTIVAVHLLQRRPAWTLVVPVVAALVLFGGIAIGGELLGWRA
ncbi:hypothetical protein [Arthrobacter monumenti]